MRSDDEPRDLLRKAVGLHLGIGMELDGSRKHISRMADGYASGRIYILPDADTPLWYVRNAVNRKADELDDHGVHRGKKVEAADWVKTEIY